VNLPNRIKLVEVGPRDGLQSLPTSYPLEVKLDMIATLARTGLEVVEVTAFGRPDVIPQLADADELMARIPRVDGCAYRGLVPNRRGAERAAAAGVDEMLGLVSASETYSAKNQNMTVEQGLIEVAEIARIARASCIRLVVGVAVAMFCPYEGDVPPERVLALIERMRESGVEELQVASSAGLDGPRVVYDLCSRIRDRWPDMPLGLHLHNTNGMALANAIAGLEAGVSVFEGAICGVGGGIRMPAEMPPFGNVATEDLNHMFYEMGIETGVGVADLVEAARQIGNKLDLGVTLSYALAGATKASVRERAGRGTERS